MELVITKPYVSQLRTDLMMKSAVVRIGLVTKHISNPPCLVATKRYFPMVLFCLLGLLFSLLSFLTFGLVLPLSGTLLIGW